MVSITHDEAVSILKAVKEIALLRIEKNAISATTDDDEEGEEEEEEEEVCVCACGMYSNAEVFFTLVIICCRFLRYPSALLC